MTIGSSVSKHEPVEVFCLAEFLSEELGARDLTTTDVALRMGGTVDEISKNILALDLLLLVQSDKLLFGDKYFAGLARALDVSESFLREIDGTWRKWPDRRSPFTPPESVFGPISRRALICAGR